MEAFNGYVIGGALNMRATTSTSSDRLTQIPNGTNVTVSLVAGAPEWLSTSYGGYSGFVLAQYIAVTNSGGECTVTTESGGLNVREAPQTDATRIYVAARNSSLRLLDYTSYSGWYCVSSSEGTGWAQSQFLTVNSYPNPGGGSSGPDIEDAIPAPTTPVTGSLMYGNSGPLVRVLKARLTELCYYCGTVDEEFDSDTEWAVKYFQSVNGLTVDCITGNATNAKLNAYGVNCGTKWGVSYNVRHELFTPEQYYMNGGTIWANTPFDAKNTTQVETIGDSGNCPTSFAMIASGLRQTAITPPIVCNFVINKGYRDDSGNTGVTDGFFAAAAAYFGFVYHMRTDSMAVVKDQLERSNLALVRIVGNSAHHYCSLTGATYLVVYKIENGLVYVMNPNYNTRDQQPLSYNTWNTASWVREAHIYGQNG